MEQPEPAPPPLVDPWSGDFQDGPTRERAEARREALGRTAPVTRQFAVVWDRHTGYGLLPVSNTGQWIPADFLNDDVSAEFDRWTHREDMADFVGRRLICTCTGVSWTFGGGEHFTIQSALIEWSE